MKRKALFITFILSAIFSLICTAAANAEETATLKYVYSTDRTFITIKGLVSDSASVIVIPAMIDGLPVKVVDGFEDCTNLVDITLPEGIESIAASAFENCTGLTSIVIPDTVTSIGSSAFEGCTGLENIELSQNLTDIDFWTFKDCTGLESIVIPDSVETIGSSAFSGCTSMTDITIGSGVKTFAHSAFGLCDSLENMYIKDLSAWVQIDFGSNALTVPENVYINNVLANNVVIPNDVALIGQYAFYNWDCLESVEIPDSVKSIADNAFAYCENLKSVTIGNNVETIGNSAFMSCENLTGIVIPDSVTTLGTSVFEDCSSLKRAVMGSGVTEIPSYTFDGCRNLANVTLGSNVKTIGNWAFCDTFNLKEITFPQGLETIGEYVFNTSGLITITIPDSVTSLGLGVFMGCAGLKDVTFGSGLDSIPGNAFSYCEALETLVMGSKIQTIAYGAFERTNVFTVYYDGTAEDVATIVVDDLNSLNRKFLNAVFFFNGESPNEEIVAESGVCDGTAVTWSLSNKGTMTFSGSGASPSYSYDFEVYVPWYNHASNIKAVIIEDGITSIDNELFQNCSTLTRILVPNSIESIAYSAFAWCNEDVSLYYAGSEEQFNAIEGIENIPEAATIYYNATGFSAPIVPTEAKITRLDAETDAEYSFSVEIEKVYDNSFVYAAIYDSEYNLIKLEKVSVEDLKTTISVDKNENAVGAKIFVWTDNLQPVTVLSTVEL